VCTFFLHVRVRVVGVRIAYANSPWAENIYIYNVGNVNVGTHIEIRRSAYALYAHMYTHAQEATYYMSCTYRRHFTTLYCSRFDPLTVQLPQVIGDPNGIPRNNTSWGLK